MITTEHRAKTPSTKTGLFATLAGLLRGRGSGAPALRLLGLAVVLAAALALPAAASAAEPLAHIGEIEGPEAGVPFQAFNSEAIAPNDHNGHVYVADSGAHRVYDFESAADTTPEVWNGGSSTHGGGTPAGEWSGALAVAVDNSSGDVYVADSSHAVIEKFDQSGNLIESFGDTENEITHTPEPNGQLAGLKTPATSFSPAANTSFGIAVDQKTGDLYAIDAGHEEIDAFTSEGEYLPGKSIAEKPGELYADGGAYTDGIAVNDSSEQLLVSDSWDLHTYRFDLASGAFIEPALDGHDTPAESFGRGFTSVAAADKTGSLFVSDTTNGVVDQFECSGGYTAQIEAAGEPHALAVDQASGEIYLADAVTSAVQVYEGTATTPCALTKPATAVEATAATLHGAVNPNGAPLSACKFEYVTDAAYQENLAHTAGHNGFSELSSGGEADCVPAAGSIAADSELHAVEADLTGLEPGTTYHFRLAAADAGGTGLGGDETLETPQDPRIDAASATTPSPTTANLSAQVNPRGFATDCHFEYDTVPYPQGAAPHGTTVPCNPANLGSGNSDVPVSAQLTGLSAGTTYHWRIVAHNENGTAQSFDHTFVFLPPPPHETCPANEAFRTGDSANLPDCRAYEQVTPPNKNGALVGTMFSGLLPGFSAVGSRLILTSGQCFGGSVSCPVAGGSNNNGTSFSFTRTAAGWQTTPLSPPATQFESSSPVAVSPNTGAALYEMPTPPSGEYDFYLRRPEGSFTDVGPGTPPAEGPRGPVSIGTIYSTADLSHFAFENPGSLWPFTGTLRSTAYEYAGTGNSQPLLVGVSGGFESHDLISPCQTAVGSGGGLPGSLSADGRTVYFTVLSDQQGRCPSSVPAPPANTLYARIDGEIEGKARTVPISARSTTECSGECASSPPADAAFQGASEDGTLAYFTSTQQLTDNASEDSHAGDTAISDGCSKTAGPNGCNLYLYENPQEEAAPHGHLIDVSADDTSGKGPQVQGVMAISADGTHVYFVAKGLLAGQNATGSSPVGGAENLYVYERDAAQPAGRTTFVATLAAGDDETLGKKSAHEWASGPQVANVTPDGRFLVFPSRAALTPDTSPTGVQQIFRYDAQSGTLSRVSIGERGFNDNGNSPPNPTCDPNPSLGCPSAASIATVIAQLAFPTPRRDPTMSDDGSHVFFESPVGLTPLALNDIQVGTEERGAPIYAENVYEWEANGTGSCGEASGCVSLISDGRDTGESHVPDCNLPSSATCLIGASAGGEDVYFTTTDQLTPTDTDTQLDYYDARVGGGFAEAPAPTPCQGDACPGSGTQPVQPQTHGSASFSGKPEGPRHPKKPHRKKSHRKKHGKKRAHKHQRANANRRAGK